ncbi:MAG: C39 family peptidase [Planctomycetaceae bacterium]
MNHCHGFGHHHYVKHKLQFTIDRQPDEVTCGPTCLQAIYRYFGDTVPLDQIIAETPRFREGGTLAVMLGCHALKRGYHAVIYTYNLQVFDPTWFRNADVDLSERLTAQLAVKPNARLQAASAAYLEFLALGGEIRMEDLTAALIRKYLKRSVPVLAGLSSTYLYQESREVGPDCRADDLAGEPSGHFVVLSGYDPVEGSVLVADPWLPNPSNAHHYVVGLDRAVCSILLGIVTYDANLLILRPGDPFEPA